MTTSVLLSLARVLFIQYDTISYKSFYIYAAINELVFAALGLFDSPSLTTAPFIFSQHEKLFSTRMILFISAIARILLKSQDLNFFQ